jgi:hypothetical protein
VRREGFARSFFARFARSAVARRLAALAALAAACAQPPPPPPQADTTPIPIVSPARPLAVSVVVREGSFSRSHVSPEGMLTGFAEVLDSARVFAKVLNDFPADSSAVWELQMAASDYGEPDGYTLELQVTLLRQRSFLQSYSSKQSIRQPKGTRRQLTIGPAELTQLAERAIRDLVRQIAADSENLSRL